MWSLIKTVVILAFVVWVYKSCSYEEWSLTIYPWRNNLNDFFHNNLKYHSLEECRAAAYRGMAEYENATYECGLNCEKAPMAHRILICEETRK